MGVKKPENNHEESAESSMEEETEPKKLSRSLEVVAAMQESLWNVENILHYPQVVKSRVKALKRLQLDTLNIEAEFFAEVLALECKYHKLYNPLFEKRNMIVNGVYEPTEEEAQWPSEDEEDTLNYQLKNKAKVDRVETNKELTVVKAIAENTDITDPKGIPQFWLTAFQNYGPMADMLQPADEQILNHLTDIKAEYLDKPMGFCLTFHFSPNEFFTNAVLTKEYFLKCEIDKDDPLNFGGPEIYKCKGCTINWNEGMNVTLKTVKEKDKSRTKTVQNDSFFNFFNPPDLPDSVKDEEIDDDLRQSLIEDFKTGQYIRERVIPRAVLFYTGESIEDDD